MHITTDGIVLRERAIDEFDCVLTLLTRERGIISAYARGAKKPRGTLRVPAELLSYSCFVLFSNRERYSVDKADLDTVFMGVRGDVEKLSLASYFCELTAQVAPREENADGYLRLLLNTLYLLDTGKRACGFLKPVYELRLLTMAGFMPNLVACAGCGCYEAEEMFFLPQSAQLACGECVRSFRRTRCACRSAGGCSPPCATSSIPRRRSSSPSASPDRRSPAGGGLRMLYGHTAGTAV